MDKRLLAIACFSFSWAILKVGQTLHILNIQTDNIDNTWKGNCPDLIFRKGVAF